MKNIAILYPSKNKMLWCDEFEKMVKETIPNCSLQLFYLEQQYHIEQQSLPNPIYRLLDNYATKGLNFCTTRTSTESLTQTRSDTNFDILFDLSLVREHKQTINAKKKLKLHISKDNLGEVIIDAFNQNEEVIKIDIIENNNPIYSIVEAIDQLSIKKSIHNLLHRLPYDFANSLKNKKILHNKVTSISSKNNALLQYGNVYLKKIQQKKWGWDILLDNDTQQIVIPSNNDFFYADPFLVQHNNETLLFLEKYDNKKGYAHLVYKSSEDNYTDDTVILDTGYHLSYPQVFMNNSQYYMIPESSANNTVDLYKATEFPNKWQKVKTLLEGEFVDTTFIENEGIIYLFTNQKIMHNSFSFTILKIFYSDSLNSEFKQHPMQDFVDARYARQGGAFFKENGKLYRVSQDNSKSYGRKVTIFEVLTLTPNAYQEKQVKTITPDKFGKKYLGLHTYNKVANLTVYDLLYI